MRGIRLILLVLISISLSAPFALAGPYGGHRTLNGVRLTYGDVVALAGTSNIGGLRKTGPTFEYGIASPCRGANPSEPGWDVMCDLAALACAGNPPGQGQGPGMYVFRRLVGQNGAAVTPPGFWERIGWTCFPELVPGAHTLSMAQVIKAFHDTPFALPQPVLQPPGGVTLVNLPTYYELTWPLDGFQPEEVESVTIAGYPVRIRPVFESATYRFGDGTSLGPVASLGGPYPTGDVTHTYLSPGSAAVSVTVTYSGQFQVAGSDWITIPGTVDITGPTVALTIREATARLVTR